MTATMPPRHTAETKHSPAAIWTGRIISTIVIIALLVDAATQLFAPSHLAGAMEQTGFAMGLAPVLGVITFACAILYAIPATAVLGAILVTGFLGGAICAHFRISGLGSPPQLVSLLLGVLTWAGLYARDCRIRALLPFVR